MSQGAGSHTAGIRQAANHSHALRWLMGFGGMGLFVVSTIDASIIPLPLPGTTDLLLLLLVVHRADPWLMAFAATAGSVLGGYLTWSTGRKGGKAALDHYVPKRYSKRVAGWVERNGMLAVTSSALLPPPLPLMPFLLAAGALGVSRRKFFAAFSLARTVRYGLIAWLAHAYGRRMVRAWNHYLSGWSTTIIWVFVALVTSGILFGLWRFRRMRRRQFQSRAPSLAA